MNDDAKTPAAEAIDRLFAMDGKLQTARLFDIPKANVDRMYVGKSGCPPRILEKLERQALLRDELAAGIEALIRSAGEAGLHPIVARNTMFETIKSGRFDEGRDPL